MSEGVLNQPIVFDNGSGLLKAGLAGDNAPKLVMPSYVGRPKHTKCMATTKESPYFVGDEAEKMKGLLRVQYAMEHGVVTNWTDMDRVWSYAYEKLGFASEDHPVLLTEAPLNPTANRERSAQVLFESHNVPALFVSMQAVLSLYASGETTGLVLDVGDGVSHAVPICQGFAVTQAIQRADIAGRDVTEHLQLLLRKAGYNFHTSAEREIVRSIKESACYVAMDPVSEEKDVSSKAGDKSIQYVLPDGNQITIGAERFRAPEILFQPHLVGEEWPGVQDLVLAAIKRTDTDLRAGLYEKIYLSGGSTLFNGFGARLLSEVQRMAPSEDLTIRITAPKERQYAPWIGGSVLASLPTFKRMWVSHQEWQEEGTAVLHRKTF